MKHVLAALTALILSGTGALAGACGYTYCWGAVGIGTNGAYGYSTGYNSESGALSRMHAECPACQNWLTFYNTCGAIARAPDGAWGSGWGENRQLAEYYAAQSCGQHTRSGGCRTSVWACSY